MVHCYATENDGVIITNCADKKAYFILINGNPNEIWCGMDLNQSYGLPSEVYDGDVVQIYETINECESDDYDEIVAWTNDLISELNAADYAEDWLNENCILLGSITVFDPIGFDTEPTVPTVTWTINNKEVQSLAINNKEVQSIVRVNDGTVLYQKDTKYTKITTHIIATMKKRVYTITLYDVSDTPLPNKTLVLYYLGIDGEESTTIVTNNLGQCTYNNNPFHLISVAFEGDSEYNGSSLTV